VLKIASLIPHDIKINISKLFKQNLKLEKVAIFLPMYCHWKLRLFQVVLRFNHKAGSADPYCTILSNFNAVGQYTAEF